MDFANESYVRVYTRDTMTWKRLNWQARCVWSLLLRKLDRAGVLETEGLPAAEAVALAIELPLEVVEEGLPKLFERGMLEARDGLLVAPRFLEAQECNKSDKLRAKEYRARRRSQAMGDASQNVTAESQDVTAASREITERHAASHGVTLNSLNSADLNSAELSGESARGSDQSGVQVRREIAGFNFVAGLLGRDSFSVPPVGSHLRDYTWIGSRPAEERLAVSNAVHADPWCVANPQEVDAPHLVRRWQRYLRGPAKAVERKLEPTAQEASVAARAKAERDKFNALIRAARERGDEYDVAVLSAERDLIVSKIQAQAS